MKRLALLALLSLTSCGFMKDFIGIDDSQPISIGYTYEQVEDAWGRPARRDRTVSPHCVLETWWYRSTSYVTFRDGVVWLIQT